MRGDPKGFTLLEVMVALALAGIVLVTLLGLGNRCIASHQQLRKMTQATLLAQWQMALIETAAREGKLNFTPENGRFEKPFDDFRWETRYQDGAVETVKRITLRVSWDAGRAMRSVDLTSFLGTEKNDAP